MALKPWYNVIQPREDLRDGRPLDASEFAVELDAIRRGEGREDYRYPDRFFERTYLTQSLRDLGAQVIRRLSGLSVETSAVFSLITQFGGGKTHAMAMLYHLAQGGAEASRWHDVDKLLRQAEVTRAPLARTAVFVGTNFDPTLGRSDGGVTRYTPWGEIAYQLGGAAGFEVVARHDRDRIAPAGDAIREMLPAGEPVLILMDEIMSFMGRDSVERRHVGLQLYHFIQSLSEVARSSERVVLVASLQAAPGETTPDEVRDLQNFRHMFNRLGRSMVLAAEDESAEIIRRRLFDVTSLNTRERDKTADAFAEALETNRALVPNWFPVEQARERFRASYPFHPSLLSVFERKWRSLPKFQQTRGMLRLLALWVSRAWKDGMGSKSTRDPLIMLGSAPLADETFRRAVLDPLAEEALDTVIQTDIAGRAVSIASRLDESSADALRRERVHRKTATTIFFESNGGQMLGAALATEIQLAMIEPNAAVMNIQTALEALVNRCHYLTQERATYAFSLRPNLNKLLADHRENVKDAAVDDRLRREVTDVFSADRSLAVVLFPAETHDVPDQARITFAVLAPNRPLDGYTRTWIERATQECGAQARTYKSAVFWIAPERVSTMDDRARDLLSYDAVGELKTLSEAQRDQLRDLRRRGTSELRTAVWRAYTQVIFLDRSQSLRTAALPQLHPSGSERILDAVVQWLDVQQGVVAKTVSPGFLVRKWPPALTEWSTRSVRDAFFQSPEFPRLLQPDVVKEVIARGVNSGDLALVIPAREGGYASFKWKVSLASGDVDLDEGTFVLRGVDAERYAEAQRKPPSPPTPITPPPPESPAPGVSAPPVASPSPATSPEEERALASLEWTGEVPPLVWGRVYTKVLNPFIQGGGVTLQLTIKLAPPGGLSPLQVSEFRHQLQALGLTGDFDPKS
jgi:hypothetical protein